jgi:predicted RNA-binding protein Jag
MIKQLQQFYKDLTYEQIPLFCETLVALETFDNTANCVAIGATGLAEIAAFADEKRGQVDAVEVEVPHLEIKTITETLQDRVFDYTNQMSDEIEHAASLQNVYDGLQEVVEACTVANPGLLWGLHGYVQDSVPLLFAVFSRRNDYYGSGGFPV